MTSSKQYNLSIQTLIRISKIFDISIADAYATYHRFLDKYTEIPDDPKEARDLFMIELDLVRKEEASKRIQPYLEKYSIQSFYYLTHISNLESILKLGIYSKNSIPVDEYFDISDPGIQKARHKKKVINQEDKTLHDCVPLFFAPNPPMLYALKEEYPREIVYLHIHPEILALPYIVFTDGNARSNATKQYADLEEFEYLDWELLRKPYWADKQNIDNHRENKRKRSAELLVPGSIDSTFISCVSTKNRETQQRVQEILVNVSKKIPVEVVPDFY